MKKLVSIILVMVLAFAIMPMSVLCINANAEAEGYYTYTIEGGEATITGVDSLISGDVTIPSTLGGYPVTGIGNSAFFECTGITSIIIPNGVKRIDGWALYRCTGLSSVSIPNSVETIGISSFLGCTDLTSVNIPNGVKKIDNGAFSECSGLTNLIVPNSVESIGIGAFFDCSNLTSVILPNSVSQIGNGAFEGCYDLTIYGASGTAAEEYALGYNVRFSVLKDYDGSASSVEITESGVYEIVNTESLAATVVDSDGNAVEYNSYAGGWPLVAGNEYAVTFDNFDESYSNFCWGISKKSCAVFPDTYEGGWYYDAVVYSAGRGIIKGYADGTFGTADGIQRQDFLVMLARYDSVNLDDYANIHGQFPDVGENSYYEAAVNWGYEKGIVTGYQNGYFGVSDLINREQIVTFLYRYAKYKELNVNVSYSASEPIVNQYTDFINVSDYAQKPVLWAVNRGVISGKNSTTIAPHGNAQRCEIAQIMYNIYENDIFNPDKVFEGSDSDLDNIPTTPSTPSDPSNPYGYINAWGTIEQMEADMAAYAQSIGVTYDYSLNLDNSCWMSSWIWSDSCETAEEFKNEIKEYVNYEVNSFNPRQTRVRVVFFTHDNVNNGDAGSYVENVKEELRDEQIYIYVLTM